MIFDKLAGIAERHIPGILPYLHRAKVFSMPGRWHEISKQNPVTDEELQFMQESFFLPFDVIAVEDSASCIVFCDTQVDQTGFSAPRIFIECISAATPSSEFAETAAKFGTGVINADLCFVTMGELTSFKFINTEKHKLLYTGIGRWVMAADKRDVSVDTRGSRLPPEVADPMLRNAAAALEEIFWFNSPNRFVVETSPPKVRDESPKERIIRTPNRRIYTLLTPGEIRHKLSLKNVEGTPLEQGHMRRKHYRKLTSDRFKNMKGQTIVIPATWVGPSEGTYQGRHYKVRLDL